GFSEQDPEVIWHALIKCISEVSAKLNGKLVAVSLSSAMHSLICTDKNGTAITGMMTWADARSESIAIDLKNSALGEKLYRLTGTPIHSMSPLCKLIWLRENQKDLFENTKKFLSIKSYIWHKLFRQYQIDYSIASATGLFDIQKLCWSEEACQLAGVTADQLSALVNTNYMREDMDPIVAEQMGIPSNTPFIIGASDGCCANLGSHVIGPGIAALTIGTSGAVRVTGLTPIYDYNAMLFNYLLDEKTFVSGGAVNNGGIAVDWLLQKFLNKPQITANDYELLFKTIELVPAGSNGLLFLPYLYGERAPIWNAKSSGAFLNIRPGHGQEHFLRAGIEGICFALNDVLTRLEESSVKITQLNVSGGFITSTTWMQLMADITGKNLVVFQLEDASAIGAVRLAMRLLFPENKLPEKTYHNSTIISPDKKNHELYAKTFVIYKKTYSALKDSMNLLYDLN
ncbi:MAG: gluconokinase, partial [Mucilaginibacter sp.]|nr:gluconokinase [Mucilaginibacter sp.]